MKRFFAMLLACLMLACLTGCGKDEADEPKQVENAEKTATATEAKGPFTFAGVRWDTPIEDCEAALEKGTDVQFTRLEKPVPDDYDWDRYGSSPATFAAVPGHYTILGMTIDAETSGVDYIPGITASYPLPADGAELKLETIRISSNVYELQDWSQLKTAQEVFREVDKRYGDNTCVYLVGCNWDDGITRYYTVPEKALPWLFQDATEFAEYMGWDYLCIGLIQDNVIFYISIYLDENGEYFMCLEYCDTPIVESEFAKEMAGVAQPFPWVNGKPEYVEIVP